MKKKRKHKKFVLFKIGAFQKSFHIPERLPPDRYLKHPDNSNKNASISLLPTGSNFKTKELIQNASLREIREYARIYLRADPLQYKKSELHLMLSAKIDLDRAELIN